MKIERLSVKFGHHAVLQDLDFSVPRGETLAIIGESGCGKTVLLKAIIGLVRPSQETSILMGRIWPRYRKRSLPSSGFATVSCFSRQPCSTV